MDVNERSINYSDTTNNINNNNMMMMMMMMMMMQRQDRRYSTTLNKQFTYVLIGRNSLQRKQLHTNCQQCLTNVNVTCTKAEKFFYKAHIKTSQNMHR